MKRFFLFSVLLFAFFLVRAGHLIEYREVACHTKVKLEDLWKKRKIPQSIAPVKCEVKVYDITYSTTYVDGRTIKATGLYYVPQDYQGEISMMAYHHGTRMKKGRDKDMGGEEAICVGFATDGFAVVQPDYMGLGLGEEMHLYLHLETEALASLDLMRAVRELNEKLGISLKDKDLYITGYSQGGHAAMALHKVIQERYSDEFHVVASAPMSGPYDLTGVQGEVMFKPYSHPGYLPFLIFSYNEAYHYYDDPSVFFAEPFDTLLFPFYDGTHHMGEVNRVMPEIPNHIIRPEVVEAYQNNPDFPFRKSLRENSVFDWKPEAPVLMCYCKGDEQVNWQNAKVAKKQMKANGAKSVRKLHVARKFGHGQCALFAVLHTKMFFDSIRLHGKQNGTLGPVSQRFLLRLGKWAVKKEK
ncbi:MAG: prolyl oligopeptidase family serine peptidase [Bacteroidia bacterium]|nr:prolyl oligopeptidase family serine peptidase [Bacteroidia bacterium]